MKNLCRAGGGLYLHADTALYQFLAALKMRSGSQTDVNRRMQAVYLTFDINSIATGDELRDWLKKARVLR